MLKILDDAGISHAGAGANFEEGQKDSPFQLLTLFP